MSEQVVDIEAINVNNVPKHTLVCDWCSKTVSKISYGLHQVTIKDGEDVEVHTVCGICIAAKF